MKRTDLTFKALRIANRLRLPKFKNKHGQLAHSKLDGSDWTRSDWLEALVGEIGEYSNLSKKYRRGDITKEEFMQHARKELADVQIYLDLLALSIEIDLEEATVEKFNEVSDRIGVNIKL